MTTLDPAAVYLMLKSRDPACLDKLPPNERGIYALRDHTGAIRYVGMTPKGTMGFHGRMNRHVSGSEDRSHKYSRAYNTGRLYRADRDRSPGAMLAKKVRAKFIRLHCRATFVIVPPPLKELGILESAVQALARPEGNHDWGDKRNFTPLDEPKELVDGLLDQLGLSSEERAALDRQATLCATL